MGVRDQGSPSPPQRRVSLTCGIFRAKALLGNLSQGTEAQTHSQTYREVIHMCLTALIPHTYLGAAKAVALAVKLHLLWGQGLHANAVPITYRLTYRLRGFTHVPTTDI